MSQNRAPVPLLAQIAPKVTKIIDNNAELKYTYKENIIIPALTKCAFPFVLYILWGTTQYNVVLRIPLVLILIFCFNNVNINLEESITIIQDSAIQLETTSGIFKQNKTHKLIPMDEVNEIVINEGFKGIKVIYYLALIRQDSEKLILIFPSAELPVKELIPIRKNLRSRIFDRKANIKRA